MTVTLQIVLLRARQGSGETLAQAMAQALPILQAADGYRDHRFGPGTEEPDGYVLLVWWRSLDDHVVRFRQSPPYRRWRALLDAHVHGEPYVRHFSLPL